LACDYILFTLHELLAIIKLGFYKGVFKTALGSEYIENYYKKEKDD
jgi:hypothetical protein